jgi:hypothetical protein
LSPINSLQKSITFSKSAVYEQGNNKYEKIDVNYNNFLSNDIVNQTVELQFCLEGTEHYFTKKINVKNFIFANSVTQTDFSKTIEVNSYYTNTKIQISFSTTRADKLETNTAKLNNISLVNKTYIPDTNYIQKEDYSLSGIYVTFSTQGRRYEDINFLFSVEATYLGKVFTFSILVKDLARR